MPMSREEAMAKEGHGDLQQLGVTGFGFRLQGLWRGWRGNCSICIETYTALWLRAHFKGLCFVGV